MHKGEEGMYVLDILPEITDMTPNFLPRLEREGDDWDEAEGEPFPVSAELASRFSAAWHRETGAGEPTRLKLLIQYQLVNV